jgi:hypothetical protein
MNDSSETRQQLANFERPFSGVTELGTRQSSAGSKDGMSDTGPKKESKVKSLAQAFNKLTAGPITPPKHHRNSSWKATLRRSLSLSSSKSIPKPDSPTLGHVRTENDIDNLPETSSPGSNSTIRPIEPAETRSERDDILEYDYTEYLDKFYPSGPAPSIPPRNPARLWSKKTCEDLGGKEQYSAEEREDDSEWI